MRGPVSAEGDDRGGRSVLGGHKAGRAEPGAGLIEASRLGCDRGGGVCPYSTCCSRQGFKSILSLHSSHLSAERQLKTQQIPGSSQINNVEKTEAFNIWKINNNIEVFKNNSNKKLNRKRGKQVKSSSGLVPV